MLKSTDAIQIQIRLQIQNIKSETKRSVYTIKDMGMLTHATTRPYNVNCVHTTKALHAKKNAKTQLQI